MINVIKSSNEKQIHSLYTSLAICGVNSDLKQYLRIAEINKLDMKTEDGKVMAYRARISLSFKYHSE
jgi:flavin-binding protein dodecin